jgi:hypothetical protein
MACLRQRSGMTPEPTPQDETANRSDGSAADGIEDDHTGHHERQDDEGCTALPVALRPSEHNPGACC